MRIGFPDVLEYTNEQLLDFSILAIDLNTGTFHWVSTVASVATAWLENQKLMSWDWTRPPM